MRETISVTNPDRATVLVEIGGYKVKVLYFFKVMQSVAPGSQEYDPYQDKKNCPQGEKWRMSLNPDDLNADLITFQSPVRWTGGPSSQAAGTSCH